MSATECRAPRRESIRGQTRPAAPISPGTVVLFTMPWPPRRFPGAGHEPKEQKMKLDRRTVLSGTAAAFAVPLLASLPARADAKRQSLVDACLESARKVLSGPDFPDAAKV